jgi:CRP-like cAMP-binding protein
MYLIIDGLVQIVSKNLSTIYAEVGQDAYFGEVALFFGLNRTATVRYLSRLYRRCKTDCTLLKLRKHVVMETLKEYSHVQDSIKSKAKFHYEEYLKRIENMSATTAVITTNESTLSDLLKKVNIRHNLY